MEKRNKKIETRVKRIVILGTESTGKTTLCKQLSEYFNTIWVPEYAREYVEKLDRPYNYNDIVKISKKQIEVANDKFNDANKFIFFDTYLIITKVWFQFVYNKYPTWLDDEIKKSNIDLFLLCNNDIKWEYDAVRENPDNREELFNIYKNELKHYKFNYKIISGTGEERLKEAVKCVNNLFELGIKNK